ncbi:glycerophosphodiester phosphodiesterase family protein [Verrucomicrobiota bacterium]
MKDTDIIAHRGASGEAPENTLSAIKLAWEQGADGVEIDVQLSKDGEIVVIHDENTARTGGVNRTVKDQTLKELKSIDAGSWKNERWHNEKIPTLSEVLNTVPAGKSVLIEVKCEPEIMPTLERVLAHSKPNHCRITICSFSLAVAQAAREHFSDHEILLIANLNKIGASAPKLNKLIKTATLNRLDGLSLCANSKAYAEITKKVSSNALKLYVWTIDSVSAVQQIANLGVNGIITNCPELLANKCNKRAIQTLYDLDNNDNINPIADQSF